MAECTEGRYAAIDIGTVTCRMLVADVKAGRVVPCAREYAITNLGEGVDATGVLKPEAMARVMDAIDRYVGVRDALSSAEHPVRRTMVAATSAARDAENADEFAALLAARGLKLAVIPGEQEAALSFRGASAECGAGEGDIMVVDVGGGSTEVVCGPASGSPWAARSFDIGCRRATERFAKSDPPAPTEIAQMRQWMRGAFDAYFEGLDGFDRVKRMVAVAGTATSVVSIREEMAVYDSDRVHGSTVTQEELGAVRARLAALPLEQRRQVAGLDPGRAPVIVAGLVILEEVMRAAEMDRFTVSESDILQGMVLEMAKGERA